MRNYLKNRSVHKVLLLILVDACLLSLAIYGAYEIKFFVKKLRVSFHAAFGRANLFHFVAVLSHIAFLYIYGLYSVLRSYAPIQVFLYALYAIATSTAFLMFLQFFVPGYWMGRIVLAIQFPLAMTVISLWRILFYHSPLSRTPKKRLAIIGSGPLISAFLQETRGALADRHQLQGVYITDQPAPNPFLSQDALNIYPSLGNLLQDPQVEAVAFQFLDPGLEESDIEAILRRNCEGVQVSDLVTLYKGMTGKVPLVYSDGRWLLSYLGIQGGPSKYYLQVKRLTDFSLAAALLLIFLPLMLVIAILIRLDSKGSVLFGQERLGQHRRSFRCLKFRTMVERAEDRCGPVWTSPDDPRITRVGKWLRRARLDELPQLINVLLGDMSLIGPRPIRAHFADQLAEHIPLYELRFALRPGLTGWAQVNHPYADTDDSQLEKFEYELFYIQNASLFLDCVILIKTIRTMFETKGQ